MLGIDDPAIWAAYLLNLAGVVLCVVYGLMNWNKGAEHESEELEEEARWEAEEESVARDL